MKQKRFSINNKAVLKKTLIASFVMAACSAQAADNRYIIEFKQGLDGNNTSYKMMSDEQRQARAEFNIQQIEQFGGLVKRSLTHTNSVAAELTDSQLAKLRASNTTHSIEEDPRRYLIEPVSGSTITPMAESVPYGINLVQALDVSDANSGNRKVCITDTGYDGEHEDLRHYTGANISGDDNNGSGSDTGDWFHDGHGHGTHVAGTVSAHGNNGIGVVGVNRSNQLGLHIVKVFNNSGQWGYGSDLVAAINQCVDAGANVISMSLGGGGSSNAEKNAFEDAFAQGVLSIAAAGNDGSSSGNDALSYPASYDIVMSVAAIDSSKRVSSWSQKNSQVEIAAPGVDVKSTLPDNKYGSYSGTSMATPHVSGVAALVWSHFTQCGAGEIRDALNSTAEDLGNTGRDQSYGYGMVRAKNAFDYLTQHGCSGNNNMPPVAKFTESCNDLSCNFDASDSYDNDGSIASYSWDFGDGNSASGEMVSHNFASNGRYDVQMTATDDMGATDTETKTIQVGPATGDSFEDTNLSAWFWGWSRKTIEIPEGMSTLTVSTSGGSGDADLYLKFNGEPGTSSYDCRSKNSGTSETCTITNPQAGTWHIGVKAPGFYFLGVTLSGEWF